MNEVNARVFDGIEKFIAAHYDPSFSLIDLPVVPLDEIGTLELVKLWRENAWRSAERLLAARTPEERATVVRDDHRDVGHLGEADLLGPLPRLRHDARRVLRDA